MTVNAHAMHFQPPFPRRPFSLKTIRNIRQPLNDILPLRNAHKRHPRNLPDPPLELPIIRSDKIDTMLQDPIDEAIVRIRALVVALEPLPALVAGNAQRDAVLCAELLELGHHARGDYGGGFGEEEVHEGGLEVEFCAHGVGEEVLLRVRVSVGSSLKVEVL